MAVKGKRVQGRGACFFTIFELTANSEGEPISVPGGADRTVQVYGTFAGGVVTLQGSLQPPAITRQHDGTLVVAEQPTGVTQFFDLTDARETLISFSTADGCTITEAVYWIKPVVTGGNSGGTTALTVVIMHRGT